MNKIFLVLGASSDVGIKLIDRINQTDDGAVIIAHYRNSNKTLLEMKGINNNYIDFVCADLSVQNEVEELIKYVKEKYVAPTHIIHLPASKFEYLKLKDIKWSEICTDLQIQVHSILSILQAFIPKMLKNDFNSKVLIMLSENTVCQPAKYTTAYTMVKYMLLGMINSLIEDYRGKKININAISPSMMNTKFLSQIDPRLLEMSGGNEKMMDVEDVVPTMMYLLSSASDRINGMNVHIEK